MKAPVLRITGKGNINILDRLIHYRMVAKLIASLKGQGGKDDKTGLSVPVNVTGPLDAPNYSVDIAGMLQEGLKDPEAVKNTVDNIKESTKDVKQQIKDIKGQAKEVKGLIKGLLGE